MTHSIDLRDYADDPLTVAALDLHRLVASWPTDVRDEVLETFGGLAIICATRGAPEHLAAAEFLTLARRLIRAAGDEADAATQPATEGSAVNGD